MSNKIPCRQKPWS